MQTGIDGVQTISFVYGRLPFCTFYTASYNTIVICELKRRICAYLHGFNCVSKIRQ